MPETIDNKGLVSTVSGSIPLLKRTWTPIWRVLTFSPADDLILPQKNLSLSIEKGILSVACGSRFFSRINIKGTRDFFFENGKYPQPKDLAPSLVMAVNEFGTTISDVTLSIPKAWAIIRTIEFPAAVKENISAAVSNEIDRLTPFLPDETFFDFRVLKDDGKKLTFLILVVKADKIKPYIEVLGDHGFNVKELTVNISGMCTYFHYMNGNPDIIFLEIDDKGYEGALVLNGSMIHVFSDNFTSEDEKTKIDIISADINSLRETKLKQVMSPQILVLFKDRNSSLAESLKQQLHMPVKIMKTSGRRTGSDSSRTKLSIPDNEIPSSAVGSVIQSLWQKAERLNLLKKGIHETQKTPLAMTIILLLIITFMGILYVVAPLGIEEKRLEVISSLIETKKEEVRKVEILKKEAETLRSETSAIDTFKKGRTMTLDILKELSSILPETAWLSRVMITETTVRIEGFANSATELLPILESSKYFRKLAFASPTYKDVRMKSDRFNILMEIETDRKFGAK
jgi:general secretion pathway protein L